LGSTYKIVPRTDFRKLSRRERPILLILIVSVMSYLSYNKTSRRRF
jgi:hypothetical protein